MQQVLDILISMNPVVVQQAFSRYDKRRLLADDARKIDPVGIASAGHVKVGQVFREVATQVYAAERARQQPS